MAVDEAQLEAQTKLEEIRTRQVEAEQRTEAARAQQEEQAKQKSALSRSSTMPSLSDTPKKKPGRPKGRQSLSAILKQAEQEEEDLRVQADDIEQELNDRGVEVEYDEPIRFPVRPDRPHLSPPRQPKRGSPGRTPRGRRSTSSAFKPVVPFQKPPISNSRDDEESEVQAKMAPVRATSFPANAKRTPLVVHHRHRTQSVLNSQTLCWASLAVSLVAYFLFWRYERLALGYCDTGSNTQRVLDNTGTADEAHSLAHTSLSWKVYDVIRPNCMPCPSHATCAFGKLISCDADYVRRPNAWSNPVVPLPDKCQPDTEKLARVIELAALTSQHLRQHHGEILCQAKSGLAQINDVTRVGRRREDLADLIQPQAKVGLLSLIRSKRFF